MSKKQYDKPQNLQFLKPFQFIMSNQTNFTNKKKLTCYTQGKAPFTPTKPTFFTTHPKRSRSLRSTSSSQPSQQNQQQKKINYKLSKEYVILLIQEQRIREQDSIARGSSLRQYYNCFISLFKMVYLSAWSAIEQCFYYGPETLNYEKLQILGCLMGDFECEWSASKSSKLMILSENVYQLSKSIGDFQKRIEYVARKMCMNRDKKHQIQNVFINQNLAKKWEALLANKDFISKNEFILDMFETDAEKLCFFDVRRFINNCLCVAEFKETIVRWCKKYHIGDEMQVSFTFEFSLIAQFCLEDDLDMHQIRKSSVLQGEENKCSIM